MERKCPICLEALQHSAATASSKSVSRLVCGHELCTECLANLLASRISSAEVQPDRLSCPWPMCGSEIPEMQLRMSLLTRPDGAQLYDRLQDLRAQAFALIGTARSRPAQCPTPGCAVVLVPVAAKDVLCPHCDSKFCSRCGTEAHPNLSCEERAARIDMLLEQPSFSRCPRCRIGVELMDGCKFLTCPNKHCRGHFCHLCGDALTQADHYSHYTGFNGEEGPFGNICRTLFDRKQREQQAKAHAQVPNRQPIEIQQRRPPPVPPLLPRPPQAPAVKLTGDGWQIVWVPEPAAQDVHVELACPALALRSTLQMQYEEFTCVYVPQSTFSKGTWEARVAFRFQGLGWGQLSEPVVLRKVPPLRLPLQRSESPQVRINDGLSAVQVLAVPPAADSQHAVKRAARSFERSSPVPPLRLPLQRSESPQIRINDGLSAVQVLAVPPAADSQHAVKRAARLFERSSPVPRPGSAGRRRNILGCSSAARFPLPAPPLPPGPSHPKARASVTKSMGLPPRRCNSRNASPSAMSNTSARQMALAQSVSPRPLENESICKRTVSPSSGRSVFVPPPRTDSLGRRDHASTASPRRKMSSARCRQGRPESEERTRRCSSSNARA